jgi:hypothetical protein
MLTVTYAECHISASNADCGYAECRGASGAGYIIKTSTLQFNHVVVG